MAHPRAVRESSILDIFWIDWDQLGGHGDGDDSQMADFWESGMAEITRARSDTNFDPWQVFDRWRQRNAEFTIFAHTIRSFFPNRRSYKPAQSLGMAETAMADGVQLARESNDLTEQHAFNMKLGALGLKGRKLVTTITGSLGLAPEATGVGDVIAILFSCNCPVILRPFGGSYIYIGECYFECLMRGEAVGAIVCGEYQADDITLC